MPLLGRQIAINIVVINISYLLSPVLLQIIALLKRVMCHGMAYDVDVIISSSGNLTCPKCAIGGALAKFDWFALEETMRLTDSKLSTIVSSTSPRELHSHTSAFGSMNCVAIMGFTTNETFNYRWAS
jgi:hypothetical protein